MAYNDPQSITVNAIARSLLRFFTGTKVGTFTSADGVTQMTIDPTSTKSRRTNKINVRENVTIVDPVTGLSRQDSHSITIIHNRPIVGVSDTVAEQLAVGAFTWWTASTNANGKKLLAGEN